MIQVYRIENGKKVNLGKSSVIDGKFTFTTDHFSTYVFIDAEADVEVTTPYTGDSTNAMMLILIMIMAGGVLLFVKKKKSLI